MSHVKPKVIKPRGRQKRTSASDIPWRDSTWVHSFSQNAASPINVQDISPGFALHKLQLLVEKNKFDDASHLINQLNLVTLKTILPEIPIVPIVENIPDSLILIESFYSKFFIADPDNFPITKLDVENTVFHIVCYLSSRDDQLLKKENGLLLSGDNVIKAIVNILRMVMFVFPDMIKILYNRRKLMEATLEGIGEHSLVSIDGELMNLHDALKLEFEHAIHAYKTALGKLDKLSLSHQKPVTLNSYVGKKSSNGNHQKLMTLSQEEIQSRLFKNKTVLNAIEPSMNAQLPSLLRTLQDRIEFDKSALLTFSQLRKEISTIPANSQVASVIAKYSQSLKVVLDFFKDMLDEQISESASYSTQGYYSDEENFIPLEGNTKENSKRAPEDTDCAPKRERRSRSKDRRRTTRGGSRDRTRGRSLDRSLVTISRPRSDSVEDSRELHSMIKRINQVSSMSRAVGRKVLEEKGISLASTHSRSSSLSSDQTSHFLLGKEEPESFLKQGNMEGRNTPSYMARGSTRQENVQKPEQQTSRQMPASNSLQMNNNNHGETETEKLLKKERSLREQLEKERSRLEQQEKVLQLEMEAMKKELSKAMEDITTLRQRESEMIHKLTQETQKNKECDQAKLSVENRGPDDNVGNLVYEFDKLYTEVRADAWTVLNIMADMNQFEYGDDLRDKLLFSVIVLAFRASESSLHLLKKNMRSLLRFKEDSHNLESNLFTFLRNICENMDLSHMSKNVCAKLFSTLPEYPTLKSSIPLTNYIHQCVHIAWQLSIQPQPYTIEYDCVTFNKVRHQRAPGSNRSSNHIKIYLWPTLLEGSRMKVAYKGVVIT
ncbi:uncharacterized protein LOC117118805 isoform X2 [Anneissia japonica]|uniref:uncharacterized protein LOC117118805 isoform X2 n=1 Tax=Anneissia japonica TaxID=1529436 RepID=UPI00142562D2|nr:uncharacterized protein LOC117118805 isoform X2 [Anneissia japonica]